MILPPGTVSTEEALASGHPWDKVIRAVASDFGCTLSAAAGKLIAEHGEYSAAERAAIRKTVPIVEAQNLWAATRGHR
jgi:hypothetical protein